jgi:hypothetical protein
MAKLNKPEDTLNDQEKLKISFIQQTENMYRQ